MSTSAAVLFKNAIAETRVLEPGYDVEVVVHINEALSEDRRYDVKVGLELLPGVRKAKFAANRHHLLLVSYDRRITSSSNVIDRIREKDLHAQLVGPM